MTYIDENGEKQTPFVIHRSSIGCYERTLALLIEKYGGAFPLWLAPVQVKVIAVTERNAAYAEAVAKDLESRGLRAEADIRNEKIGYKIREARLEKVPYFFVVGDKEAEENTVSVWSRKEGDLGGMAKADALAKLLEENATKRV